MAINKIYIIFLLIYYSIAIKVGEICAKFKFDLAISKIIHILEAYRNLQKLGNPNWNSLVSNNLKLSTKSLKIDRNSI